MDKKFPFEDDSDVINIIDTAKTDWFAEHPECQAATDETTDECINKALFLPPTGAIRSLVDEVAGMSGEEIYQAVKRGLDNWFETIKMSDKPVIKLVNLTPHAITLRGREIPPSGTVARCEVVEEVAFELEHPDSDDSEALSTTIPVMRQRFGAVTGLPDPAPGVYYVVSLATAQAVPHRTDVLIVAHTVRDQEGRIVGCEALATLHA